MSAAASAGPTSTPAPSAQPKATLAAVSCSGCCTAAGTTQAWHGRTTVMAVAARMAPA